MTAVAVAATDGADEDDEAMSTAIIIAGWGGSGGGDGGDGGRGCGRKSRCGHEPVKNFDCMVDGGGKNTLFPIAIATAVTISRGRTSGWAGNEGGDDEALQTMAAAVAALAALLSACLARWATQYVGMCANVHRLDYVLRRFLQWV